MTLLSPESPHAIIMIGIPGAGKSAFAEHFAETFKALIVSQTTLQRKYQLTEMAATMLHDDILSQYMKTSRTVLIDGGYNSKASRDDFTRTLVKAGYRPLLVWVQTDTTEAFRRSAKPFPRGSGMTTEDFDSQVQLFDPPAERERAVVISGRHTYASQLKIVLRQLTITDTSQPRLKPIVPPKLLGAERIAVNKGAPKKPAATGKSKSQNGRQSPGSGRNPYLR